MRVISRVLLSVFLCLLALVLLLPILAVLASVLQWNGESAQILREMSSTVLPDYALTSLLLCIAVAVDGAVEEAPAAPHLQVDTVYRVKP